MTIPLDTKAILLLNGNDGSFRTRITGAENLPEHYLLHVVYTETIAVQHEKILRKLAGTSTAVSLDRVRNKKNAIRVKLTAKIRDIKTRRPDVQVFLVGSRYSSNELMSLESKGQFSYAETVEDCFTAEEKSENSQQKYTEIKRGGKMKILVDYENVGSKGLVGTNWLCKDDDIALFYSDSMVGIEQQYLYDMEQKTGRFEAIKLKNVGKNGLDFYIAVKVGQMVEKEPDAKILLVTKDAGYLAISQYCEAYTDLTNPIMISDSIESGIAMLDGDTPRHNEITENRKRVSIDTAYAAYEERRRIADMIAERFAGTRYAAYTDEILRLLEDTDTPRERYLGALVAFGRNDGTDIYRILKEVA